MNNRRGRESPDGQGRRVRRRLPSRAARVAGVRRRRGESESPERRGVRRRRTTRNLIEYNVTVVGRGINILTYLNFKILNGAEDISMFRVFERLSREVREKIHERYGPENQRQVLVEVFPEGGEMTVQQQVGAISGLTNHYLMGIFQSMLHSQQGIELVGTRYRIKVLGPAMYRRGGRGAARMFGVRHLPPAVRRIGLQCHPNDDRSEVPCMIRNFLIRVNGDYLKSFERWEEKGRELSSLLGIEGMEMVYEDAEKIVGLEQYSRFQIVIVNAMHNIQFVARGNQYQTQDDRRLEDPFSVFLFHYENHYFSVSCLKQFIFEKKYRHASRREQIPCYVCYQSFNARRFNSHRCMIVNEVLFNCDKCTKVFCNVGGLEIHQRARREWSCEKCGKKDFYGSECFEYHSSIQCDVQEFETCQVCGRQFVNEHQCNKWGKCENCEQEFSSRDEARSHRCFFKRTKKFHNSLSEKLWKSHWFYDFETYRKEEDEPGVYRHDVAYWAMELMIIDDEVKAYSETEEFKELLGEHDHMEVLNDTIRFSGRDLNSLIKTCENICTKRRGRRKWHPTFWAHNGARFDSKFILEYYVNDMGMELVGVEFSEDYNKLVPGKQGKWVKEKNQVRRDVVKLNLVGTRALSVQVRDMKFQCSYAHFGRPLRDLPEMMGFSAELSKGEFPYSRIHPDNWNTIMPPLELEEFDLQSKTAQRKAEIEEWFYSRPREPFDYTREMKLYCNADVSVGRRALTAYHNLSKQLHTELSSTEEEFVSPLDFCTTPSFALAMYRTWFLPEQRVAFLKSAEAKLIRGSLRGGRTDKRANWVKVDKETKVIDYVDFTSLYPAVMRNREFPVGIPQWLTWKGPITNEELSERMANRTGFLTIDCEPIKYVTHPTLHRVGKYDDDTNEKRLVFALEPHVKETYAWPEIKEALRCGEIKVTRIHEGLLFEEGEVFKEYVDFFFKIKDEAQRNDNPGLRSLAKLLLNSLWGKLGQRSYAEREWVYDAGRREYINRMIEHGEIELISVLPKSEGRLYYIYRKTNDLNNLRNTAHQLAAFVSMWGRVELHEKILSVYGQMVLYCDTDSAILYRNKGEAIPYLGEGLGLLTNEIDKLGKGMVEPRIEELVCLAPKTYALKLVGANGDERCKAVCKGFELSVGNAEKINFRSMKDLVFTKYGINEFLREGGMEEEEVTMRRKIDGVARLTFVSSVHNKKIAPRERTIQKSLTGNYYKGKKHPHDPRLIIPYGNFEPPNETIFNSEQFIE